MIIHADICFYNMSFLSREKENSLEMIKVLKDYKWSVLPNKQFMQQPG